MREFFIYYQVLPADVDAARAIVDAFQDRLRTGFPGLSTRLLRRPAAPTETQTWMEVYARPVAGGVDAELEAAIAAEAGRLDGVILGSRHVEAFEPCAS